MAPLTFETILDKSIGFIPFISLSLDHLLVIIELAENGCLLDFLKQSRQQDGNNTTSGLTEHMKTSIAVDVARGMAHLARCRVSSK